jgi:hypothetical protein
VQGLAYADDDVLSCRYRNADKISLIHMNWQKKITINKHIEKTQIKIKENTLYKNK